MKVGFEEKTYESFFNNELDRQSNVYFPFGQVQEGFLGADAASNSRNRGLWRRMGHPFWFYPDFPGIELKEIAEFMQMSIDRVPQMKANLLFQYKRPEYIKSSNGAEWKLWKKPYFRYGIYEKQQLLLNRIDTQFGNRVLIVYASATANSLDNLVIQKSNGQIIDSSNFIRSSQLIGHHRNTYIESGNHSIACSEKEEIENLNLLGEIELIGEKKQKLNNEQFITNFASGINAIMKESKYYSNSYKKLKGENSKLSDYRLLNSFSIMSIFKQLTGIQWIIKI